jgi:hypothetical protein
MPSSRLNVNGFRAECRDYMIDLSAPASRCLVRSRSHGQVGHGGEEKPFEYSPTALEPPMRWTSVVL